MSLKDFYTILELPPSASRDEIKKAYRRLAQLYHPDKKSDDPYAAVQFSAIKEAYETLMHPEKKDAYLQERWYAKSMGRNTNGTGIVTPVVILKQLLELEKHCRKIDIHRTDNDGLYNYMEEVLSMENIELLNKFNDKSTSREIIFSALRTLELFNASQVTDFKTRINKIMCDDQAIPAMMQEIISNKQRQDYWAKRKTWLILAAVIFLCLIIYLTANY